MNEKYKTLAIVLATIAGYLMVAAAMFFAIANTGLINNNNIGIENAKARLINNISLQSDTELDNLVRNNNFLAKRYGQLTLIFFGISIFLGIVAILLALPKNKLIKHKSPYWDRKRRK